MLFGRARGRGEDVGVGLLEVEGRLIEDDGAEALGASRIPSMSLNVVPSVLCSLVSVLCCSNGEALHINLNGMGIGNGLTSPAIQYPYYPEVG